MKVLFVCTGNIFRSMSAEYIMKKYIQDHNLNEIVVSSAGTVAHEESPLPWIVERLGKYGCDVQSHKQTKLTSEVLKDKDLVICMAEHHRTVVRELGYDAVLFNEIAYGKTEDLMDDTEFGQKNGRHYDLGEYAYMIVDYIYQAMPTIIKNIFSGKVLS